MDYQALKALISTHPSWPSVTDADLLTWLKDPVGVTRDRDVVAADRIYSVIDPGKFAAAEGVQWWAEHINTLGGIKVTEVVNGTRVATGLRTAFINSLKAANQAEFDALISEQVSREVNGGFGFVRAGDLEYARTL